MPSLHDKITARTAVVGVIGLGYVGLPLARAFIDAGFPVLGFDIDPAKVASLSRGQSYLNHLGPSFVAEMNATRRFSATTDFSRLAEPDAILICVPTPLGVANDPDLSYVENTARAIAKTLRPGQLIVLESTTYPGTTRDVVLPILLSSGLALDASMPRGGASMPSSHPNPGFFLAFSPEREDPGRKGITTAQIPKLVGGNNAPSGEIAAKLYASAFERVVPVSTAEVAEAAKILENTYRAVNIALVNELKLLFEKMGIDIWEVIEAAKTKPFGFQAFYPGPGLGGHCIPIDPFYLAWKARQIGMPTRFIELAGEINHAMPRHVVARVVEALKARGREIKGARVLILGLAYKPDIDDVRESPSFELIEDLRDLGAHVDYNDPHVAKTHQMRRYDLKMSSVPLDAKTLSGYDAVVISTAHSAYDWDLIAQNAGLIVDTRNALAAYKGDRSHIVMA